MNKPFTITASNRTALARAYGVSYNVFSNWINSDKELVKLMKPYKRVLPPFVVEKIVASLGQP